MHEIHELLGNMHQDLHDLKDEQANQGRKIDRLLILSKSIVKSERKQMADTSKLTADVTKLTDLVESISTADSGLRAERDALKVERDALLAADSLDQGAIDAVDEKLVAANAKLEILAAIATNTPAEPSLGGT